jgi:hypothetical protein
LLDGRFVGQLAVPDGFRAVQQDHVDVIREATDSGPSPPLVCGGGSIVCLGRALPGLHAGHGRPFRGRFRQLQVLLRHAEAFKGIRLGRSGAPR